MLLASIEHRALSGWVHGAYAWSEPVPQCVSLKSFKNAFCLEIAALWLVLPEFQQFFAKKKNNIPLEWESGSWVVSLSHSNRSSFDYWGLPFVYCVFFPSHCHCQCHCLGHGEITDDKKCKWELKESVVSTVLCLLKHLVFNECPPSNLPPGGQRQQHRQWQQQKQRLQKEKEKQSQCHSLCRALYVLIKINKTNGTKAAIETICTPLT